MTESRVLSPGKGPGGGTAPPEGDRGISMVDPGELREGMTVRDTEGHRLGTVMEVGDTHFDLEQGQPPRREFMVRFHLVDRVEGDAVVLLPGHGVRLPSEEESAVSAP